MSTVINRRLALTLVLLGSVLLLMSCGGSSGIPDESENVGPGPGIAMISHSGITGFSFLPYWGIYVDGILFVDGGNLLAGEAILVGLPGVPVGAPVSVVGFNLNYDPITDADGFLGPFGVVLQMP